VGLNLDTKTKLLGLICAAMDGRPLRPYILELDGVECVDAHNVLKQVDDLLKAQWKLMGSPMEEDIL
jgi:hypothetical protein